MQNSENSMATNNIRDWAVFLRRSERGFTLIEIIIVVIILGVLMSLIGGKLFTAGNRLKIDATRLKMQQVKNYIEEYRMRYNVTPNSLADLTQCTEATGSGCVPFTSAKDLVDAWNTQLRYRPDEGGRTYHIISLGSDQREGGDSDAADFELVGP